MMASSGWNFSAWCTGFWGGVVTGRCQNLWKKKEDEVCKMSPQPGWRRAARHSSVAGSDAAREVAAGMI
jgi:hypothetical protein